MSEGQQHHIALPAGYRLENYRLDAVLGHGGFGITYQAVDEDLQQVMAIKEYLPREVAFRDRDSTVIPLSEGDREVFEWGLERFLDEARTLARFRHSHIVGVRRFLRANGTAYLVMDYCAGESLESVLAREGTLDPERLVAMLVPLLDALEALHAAGVTHRDIKPGNIYLREDGSPVLLDFGAARQALAQHSRSVTAMATPGYAAFEQYSTKGKQGPWTDIYGLGATLYRCVTGQRPPDASDRMLEDELVPTAEVASDCYPRPLLQQIDAALKLRPQDRPQSVEQWSRFGLDVGVQETRQAVLSSPQGAVTQQRDSDSANPARLIADRYRVRGEHGEIIEDTVTDLQWQRCTLGQTWNGRTCVGDAHRYTWDEAQEAANGVPGWRLPTIEELRTLVYCSSGQPTRFSNGEPCKGNFQRPTLDPEAFQNAPSSYFWSGSSGANDSYSAWGVHFYHGWSYDNLRSSYDRVRLVRGSQRSGDPAPKEDRLRVGATNVVEAKPRGAGEVPKAVVWMVWLLAIGTMIVLLNGAVTRDSQTSARTLAQSSDAEAVAGRGLIEGRYQILGARGEMVRDTVTGLEWQRCSLGQEWTGSTCIGQARRYTWDEALQEADRVAGWRLPTVDELETLNSQRLTMVREAFPNTPHSSFWSGSLDADNSLNAWFVKFSGGRSQSLGQGYHLHVRLVRGGQ